MLVVNRDEGRTHVQASFPAGQYHDYPSLTQAHTVAFLGNLFPGIPPMQILHHYWIRQYASKWGCGSERECAVHECLGD